MKTEQYIEDYTKQLEKIREDREISIQTSKDRLLWLEQNKDSIPEWLYKDGAYSETDNINHDQGFYLEEEFLTWQLGTWKNRLKAIEARRNKTAA